MRLCSEAVQYHQVLGQLPGSYKILCLMLAVSSPLFACFETFGPAVLVEQ